MKFKWAAIALSFLFIQSANYLNPGFQIHEKLFFTGLSFGIMGFIAMVGEF